MISISKEGIAFTFKSGSSLKNGKCKIWHVQACCGLKEFKYKMSLIGGIDLLNCQPVIAFETICGTRFSCLRLGGNCVHCRLHSEGSK